MNKAFVNKLIASLAENDAIPNFRFKQGTVLEKAVSSLTSTSSMHANEETDVMVQRWMSDLESADSIILDTQIDEIADSFVDGILGIARTLRSLHTEVSDITTKIEAKIDFGVSINPKLAKLLDGKNVEIDYLPIDYAPLANIGTTEAAMESIRGAVTGTNAADRSAYYRVLEAYVQVAAPGVPVDILITPDDKEKIIDEVNASGSNWDKDMVKDTLNLLTNPVKIKSLIATMDRTCAPTVDKTASFMHAISVLQEHTAVMETLQLAILNNGYEAITTAPNFKKVMAVLETYFYYVNYHRATTFADTAVFNNLMSNPDNVGAIKQAGITTQGIARYIAVRHGNKLVSETGATVSAIVGTKSEVEEKFEQTEAESDVYTNIEVGKIRRRSLINVVATYLGDLGIDDVGYVAGKADELMRTKATVDDVVYGILIGKLYPNTLVGTMYERLGTAYAEAVVNNPKVDVIAMNETTIDTYLGVVVELLAKNLVT